MAQEQPGPFFEGCAKEAMSIMMYQPEDNEGMRAYRAPSLFQPHRARQALRDAHNGVIPPLAGLYLGLSSLPTARFVAPMGFDVVWVDWEHTSCNVETMTNMVHELMFMSEGRTIPFVRVPGHDHAAIGYALDAGASIVCPQVDTVEQAKHIVYAAKFGRKNNGGRSVPPFRLTPGLTDGVADPQKHGDVWQQVNDNAAIMIQIESKEGLDNLDAILTEVPEIDAVWIGTLDMRVSMGFPANGGMGGPEPEWQGAVAKYMDITTRHGKPRGGMAIGPDDMFNSMHPNLDFVIGSAEVIQLMSLQLDLKRMREATKHRITVKSAKAANGHAVPVANGTASR